MDASSSYIYHLSNTYGPFIAVTANENCSVTLSSKIDYLDYIKDPDSWHGFKSDQPRWTLTLSSP